MAGSRTEALMKPGMSDERERVTTAAWFLENAVDGAFPANGQAPQGDLLIDLLHKKHRLMRLRRAYDVSVVLLAVMMLFETPLWCDTDTDTTKFIPGNERCHLPDGKDAELSGFPMIPPLYGILLECVGLFVCTATLAVDMAGNKAMAKAKVSRFSTQAITPETALIIAVMMWLDIAVYAVFRQKCFRFAPYGRIALFFFWRRVCGVFLSVKKCAGEFLNISLMYMLTVIFFAWIFTMLLDDAVDREGVNMSNKIGDNFKDLASAFRTFFTMAAGAGFPDRADEAMHNLQWTPFLFFPFMLLTFFLFTQIMLAIVYEVYQNVLQERLKEFYDARTKGVARAFLELCAHGHKGEKVVPFMEFQNVLEVLKENPRLKPSLKDSNTHLIFQALDDDGSGELDIKEFFDACDLLLYRFWQTPATSWLERSCGMKFPALANAVEDGKVDSVVNGILILNVCFIIVESWFDLHNMTLPFFFDTLENFFSLIYVVDVLLRLMVMSFSEYWSWADNRFDFIVSWVLFAAGMHSILGTTKGFGSDLVRYLNILRFVRLLKLLKEMKRFKKMTLCISQLVQVSFDMVALLLLSSLFYAVIGAQLFGGKMYKDNPLLQDKDWVNNGYDIMSFNDMARSIGAIFCFIVNNYCPEYAEAMDIVTGVPWIGLIYCGLFFFVGVNIAFNVFTAFTIDVFLTLRSLNEEAETSEEDHNLTAMKETCRQEGNILHVSIPPEVLRMRVQIGVLDDLEGMIAEARASATRSASAVLPTRELRSVTRPAASA